MRRTLLMRNWAALGAMLALPAQAAYSVISIHCRSRPPTTLRQRLAGDNDMELARKVSTACQTRRNAITGFIFGIIAEPAIPLIAHADDDDDDISDQTRYFTGKAPVPAGKARPKKGSKGGGGGGGSGGTNGTRKDPKFLRSLADCKNQCENSAGPDGLARSKEECLSDCQDICCMTYEQCTFPIVKRI